MDRGVNSSLMEQRINEMLGYLIGWDEVDKWWRTPHDAFNGLAPGDADLLEVYDYVEMCHKTARTWE